jgi:TonB family protein
MVRSNMLIPLLALLAPGEVPANPIPVPVAPPPIVANDYLSELPRSGITPEMLNGPHKPKANLVALFSTDDYPLESIRNGEQGTVGVILKVGRDGKVADCVVYQSSGFTALDSQTCRLLWMRAAFDPARDKSGRPIEGAFRQRIRWELPPPQPMPFKAWSTRFTIELVRDGGVIACRLETTGIDKDRSEECDLLSKMWQSSLSRLRADAGYERRTLVSEVQFAPNNRTVPAEAPAGTRLFARQVMRLTIDANGKTLQCRVIETEGLKSPIEECDDLLDNLFERPGIKVGAVEATMVRTAYVSE